jgi:Ni,Fe-hydrogenase I cytochrome b subunit
VVVAMLMLVLMLVLMAMKGVLCTAGKKTPLFAPFIYKSHLFTKTGSGQT